MFKSNKTLSQIIEKQEFALSKQDAEIETLKNENECLKSLLRKTNAAFAKRGEEMSRDYDRLAAAAAKKATPPEGCAPGEYCRACALSFSINSFPSGIITYCGKDRCKHFTPKEKQG